MKEALERALDLVDEAVTLLRDLALEKPGLAEELEEVIYLLEEAGEKLDSMYSRLR